MSNSMQNRLLSCILLSKNLERKNTQEFLFVLPTKQLHTGGTYGSLKPSSMGKCSFTSGGGTGGGC